MTPGRPACCLRQSKDDPGAMPALLGEPLSWFVISRLGSPFVAVCFSALLAMSKRSMA